MASNSYIGATAGVLNITGVISDLGAGASVTKVGHGEVIFATANTYRGQTTVDDGILDIQNPLSLGTADNTAATSTIVNQSLTQFGTLQIDDPTGVGFTITNELLTLNGGGYNPGTGTLGALYNFSGNNTWAGNIIIGSPNPVGSAATIDVAPKTTLTVTGNGPGASGVPQVAITSPNGAYAVNKTGTGTLIFTTPNTYTGATNVQAGILEIKDSDALGTGTVTVSNAATLELAVDNLKDSVTADTKHLTVANTLNLLGLGINGVGALYSHTGINTWTGPIFLENGSGAVAIGVDPAANPTGSPYNYDVLADGTVIDDSLKITGNIGNFGTGAAIQLSEQLNKVDAGQLILPKANTYNGAENGTSTDIQAGWVTIENSKSLGLLLSDPTINAKILNDVGLTVEPVVRVEGGASLHILPLSGSFDLVNNFVLSGVGPTIAGYPLVSQKGALMSLSGSNILEGNIQLGGTVGIGVEQVFSSNPSAVPAGTYSANYFSQLVTTGQLSDGGGPSGVTKFGSQRLILQGPGTYTGANDISAGVLLVQNNTALGAGGSSTTVENGAALEFGTSIAAENGGIASGIDVFNEQLILNGTGNANFGDNTVTVFSSNGTFGPAADTLSPIDVLWNGPVTLNTAAVFQVQPNSRINFIGTIDDSPNPSVSGSDITLTGGGELALAGVNTYRGTTYENQGVLTLEGNQSLGSTGISTVQTFGFNGALANLTKFKLTFNGSTTAPLLYTGTAADIATIQAALNALPTIGGATDVAGTATVSQPSSGMFSVTFGGSFIGFNQTQLTGLISSGPGTISEVQTITLTGAVANSTQLTLTFNGATTAPLLYTGTPVDAGTFQNALNSLSTVNGVGGTVTVTRAGNGIFNISFGGTLGGFGQTQITGAVTTGPGSILGTTGVTGAGGTVVAAGASLQLQGSVTIAGEPLIVQGSGISTSPNVPEQWFSVGPAPITNGGSPGNQINTGRVTAVTVDPTDNNVIYIGTAGGGAWKTIDNGKTWRPLFENQKALYVGAIAIDPTNAQTIYLGTGDTNNSTDSFYGTGVYKSTDSGITWSLLLGSSANPFASRGISKIIVDPNNPSNIFVASGDGGPSAPGQDEVQDFVSAVSPITLSFEGVTTAPFNYTGNPATDVPVITAALQALSTIGGVGGIVTVASDGAGGYTVTFSGTLSNQSLPIMVVNPGPTNTAIAITTFGYPPMVVNGTLAVTASNAPGVWHSTAPPGST